MKKVLFLLGHLNDLDIEWMISHGNKNILKTGDRLIRKGDSIKNLFIVLNGQLSIIGDSSKENIALIGTGEIVGEMSFLESKPPSVSVIATKSTTVFSISTKLIENRLANNLEFKANFYYSISLFLSNRLRKTTDQLGYGDPIEDDPDIINENVLDGISKAGSRFGEILKKFSEV